MGNKDNPRRQLHYRLLTGGIAAILLGGGGYGLHSQSVALEKQEKLISQYQHELVEQGSLIDQQKEQLSIQKQTLSSQDEKIVSLTKTIKKLDTKVKTSQKKEKEYKDEIRTLEEQLSFKKANTKQAALVEAKHTGSTKKASAPSGRTMTVEATGYIAMCSEGCTGITATGMDLRKNPNAKVIAVDPSVIPLGTRVYVPGYGEAIAADTGGAINGSKIDVHFPNTKTARDWGRRSIQITILD